jgi:hypothetical protein
MSVIYSHDITVKFKIVLPFLFTSGAYNEPLSNIDLRNRSVGGVSYLHLGANATSSVCDVNIQSLYSIVPGVSYDFSGRSVCNAGKIFNKLYLIYSLFDK